MRIPLSVYVLTTLLAVQSINAIKIPEEQFEELQKLNILDKDKKTIKEKITVGWLYIDFPKQNAAVLVSLVSPKVIPNKKLIYAEALFYTHPTNVAVPLLKGLYFYREQNAQPNLTITANPTPNWGAIAMDKEKKVYIYEKKINPNQTISTIVRNIDDTTQYHEPSAEQYPSDYIQQLFTAIKPSTTNELYPPTVLAVVIAPGTFKSSVQDTISEDATDAISKESFGDLAQQLPNVPLVIASITTEPHGELTYHFAQAKDLDEQFFAHKKPFDKNPINGEEPIATPTYYVLSNIDKKYIYLTDANVRNRTTPLDLFLQEFLNMVLVTKDTKLKTMVPLVWDRLIDLTKLEPLYKAISNAQEKKRADELLALLFKNYVYLGVEAWRNPHLTAIRTIADKVIPSAEIFKKQ